MMAIDRQDQGPKRPADPDAVAGPASGGASGIERRALLSGRAPDETDEQAVFSAIAQAVRPRPLAVGREQLIGARLRERAGRSAAAHRGLCTVRRGRAAGYPADRGVRVYDCFVDAAFRIACLDLAPGVAMPWPQGVRAQEVLVMRGAVVDPDAGAGAPSLLGPLAHATRRREDAGPWHAGEAGASVYVRQRLADDAALPAAEARWWHQATARSSAPGDPRARPSSWRAVAPGVQVRMLCGVMTGDQPVASMMVRLAPGAQAGSHGHEVDETCLMLEGDLFLGDILLQAGDFQLAPAGTRHVDVTSDAGCLFYFHGDVPVVAR